MLGLSERSIRFFSAIKKNFCKISHIGSWGKTYETSPKLHMRTHALSKRDPASIPFISCKFNKLC